MKTTIITIAILLFVTVAFAQQDKYPYRYDVRIPDPPPHCFFERKLWDGKADSFQTVKLKILESGLRISGKPGLKLVDCIIIPYNTTDTFRVKTEPDVSVDVRLPAGPIEIYTKSNTFSDLPLSYVGSWSAKIVFLTIVLGIKGELSRPVIRSKRPLTDHEIEQMIDQAVKQKQDSRLMSSRICYWTYEI